MPVYYIERGFAMVMKQMRSKKFARRALAIIAVLFIPAFILWGVGSVSSRDKTLIGKIYGNKIFIDDLAESRRAVRIQLITSGTADAETFREITGNRELMNRMAWERLILLEAARNKGIRTPNEEVVEFISAHPLFRKNGRFDNTRYKTILANTFRITPRDFEEAVRENLDVRKIRQEIIADAKIEENQITSFYMARFGKYSFSYVPITREAFPEDPKISDEDLKTYYEKYREHFYTPQEATIEYLIGEYETRSERDAFRGRVTSLYSSIIEEDVPLKSKAGQAGMEFGEAGPFSREDIVPGIPFSQDFYDTVFDLGPGETSQPLFISSGDNGYALIIKKTGHTPRSKRTFDEVKQELRTAVLETERTRMLRAKAMELYDRYGSLESIATETSLPVRTTGKVGRDSYIDNFGPASLLIEEAAGSNEGTLLPPVSSGMRVIIPRLDKIFPPDKADLEEKRSSIEGLLLRQAHAEKFENWFREHSDKVELNTDLAEV
jgi:hypothetical protein